MQDHSEDNTNMEQGQDSANSDLEVTQGLRQMEPQLEPTQMADGIQNATDSADNANAHDATELRTDVSLKTGQIVKYEHRGVLYTAKVLGHAEKATGKYKDCIIFFF